MSLGSIIVRLTMNTGSFDTDAKRAASIAKRRAAEIDQAFRKAGAAIGVALGAGALAAAAGIKLAIDRMDEIIKSAQKVGISSESFSKLAYAANLAGIEMTALEGALAKLAKSQDMAAQGSAEQLKIFRALGVEFANADGTLRKTDAVLTDLADAFQRLPDGANKTAAAMALLGRSGAQMIPLLNGGSESLTELGDELESFGGVVGPEAARMAEQFNDNLTRLKTASDGLWQSLATQLLPDLVALTEKLVKASKEGGELRDVMDGAASFVSGLGMAAQLAIDSVQGLTSAAIGLYNVFDGLQRLSPPGWLRSLTDGGSAEESFRNAGVAFSQAGAAFDETSANLYGAPAGAMGSRPLPGQGTGRRGGAARLAASEAASAAAAEKALAGALAAARTESERKAAATSAAAAADRAAAAAAREQAQAEREQAAATAEAYDEVQRVFKTEQEEKQKRAQDAADAKAVVDTLLADLAFEAKLLAMTNLEREKAIALRYANVEAASAEGMAISGALDEMDRARQVAEGMDVVRGATEGLFNDLMDGSKSASDAFKDFVDNILAGIAQIVAKNLTEQLLGSFGSTGGGASGGGLASLFGSLFGGARATGGPIYGGKAYLVGESGPELVIPKSAGTVVPASRTAAMLGGAGGGVVQNIAFNLPGRYDMRTQQQMQADMQNLGRKSLARGTAG